MSATAPTDSLLVQLPHGGAASVLRDPMPRLPASVFAATSALKADPRVLTVLAVSKGAATRTMARLDDFYLHTLQVSGGCHWCVHLCGYMMGLGG